MTSENVDSLWQRARAGDQAAMARILTLVEAEGPDRHAVLELVHPHTGHAHRIGVAGPPGAGKSTLISQLARRYADRGRSVGVVAVDPSSPLTGGALLGDRVRMNELEGLDSVFVRSLATRGQPGGLSLATGLVADVLDALGYDPVLMETVGVGQAEIDVMRKAHSVVLLLLPGAGDAIQLMKAGLLEVADILLVNKSDREGAQELAHLLRSEVEGRARAEGAWITPVIQTTAYKGEGMDELLQALNDHFEYLRRTLMFEDRRRAAIKLQLRQLVERALLERIWGDEGFGEILEGVAADVADHRTDVASAARDLAAKLVLPAPD